MKNPKGQTIYSEEIYPSEFRMRYVAIPVMPFVGKILFAQAARTMPVLMTGWVQVETHIQWGYQSLS